MSTYYVAGFVLVPSIVFEPLYEGDIMSSFMDEETEAQRECCELYDFWDFARGPRGVPGSLFFHLSMEAGGEEKKKPYIFLSL